MTLLRLFLILDDKKVGRFFCFVLFSGSLGNKEQVSVKEHYLEKQP